MRFVIAVHDPMIIVDLGFVLKFPDSGLPFCEELLEGGGGGHTAERVESRRCDYGHIRSLCTTMQHFALDLFTLCTNHGAAFPRSSDSRAMCPNYAYYKANTPQIAVFVICYKAIKYDIIKIILQFSLFQMQRFAKLCITLHNYIQECTDSTLHPSRAKCCGSFSPRLP